jgi:hypothetical protein
MPLPWVVEQNFLLLSGWTIEAPRLADRPPGLSRHLTSAVAVLSAGAQAATEIGFSRGPALQNLAAENGLLKLTPMVN